MKNILVCLLIFSMFLQIGCSSITQIPLPIEETKSESDIRSLNYFGERLSSTIILDDSIEVEAYWLKLRDDKIYFLTEGLDDTTSILVERIKSVRFFDWWRGCLYGGLGGIVYLVALLGGTAGAGGEGMGLAVWVLMALAIAYGVYALSEREFNFVQSK